MDSTSINQYAVILSALTLLSIIVKAWIDWKVQGRVRKWLLEDKEEVKKKLDETGLRIAENTGITLAAKDDAQKAYKEANDVNKKLSESQTLAKAVVDAALKRDTNSRTRATDK